MEIFFILLVIIILRKRQSVPYRWMEPTIEYYYILPIASKLPFENDVMVWKEIMMRWGEKYGVEAAVIAAVLAQESKGKNIWDPESRFVGLMQIGTSEARAMGYTGDKAGLLNPDVNIHYGTAYISYWLKQKPINGFLPSAISGYNAGKVAFVSGMYINQSYVDSVISYLSRFRFLLMSAYPGYARVFPQSTWFKSDGYA